MSEQKQEKKEFGKSMYVKCSGCGENKFTRADVYKNRVKKFGSEEKMLAEYLCMQCRKNQ